MIILDKTQLQEIFAMKFIIQFVSVNKKELTNYIYEKMTVSKQEIKQVRQMIVLILYIFLLSSLSLLVCNFFVLTKKITSLII